MTKPNQAVTPEEAFEAIEQEVLAWRDIAAKRSSAVVAEIDLGLSVLFVLEDCAETLKSARVQALDLLRQRLDDLPVPRRTRAGQITDQIFGHDGGRG